MFPHAAAEIGSTTPQLLAEVGGMLLALGIVAFIAARYKFSVVPVYLLIGLLLGDGGILPIAISEDFFEHRSPNWGNFALAAAGT